MKINLLKTEVTVLGEEYITKYIMQICSNRSVDNTGLLPVAGERAVGVGTERHSFL